MRLVDVAENHPNVCLVTRDFNGPFVDFECFSEDVDPHIYLSAAVVKQAAQELGMVELDREITEFREKLAELEARIQNLAYYKQSIDALAEQEAALEGVAA